MVDPDLLRGLVPVPGEQVTAWGWGRAQRLWLPPDVPYPSAEPLEIGGASLPVTWAGDSPTDESCLALRGEFAGDHLHAVETTSWDAPRSGWMIPSHSETLLDLARVDDDAFSQLTDDAWRASGVAYASGGSHRSGRLLATLAVQYMTDGLVNWLIQTRPPLTVYLAIVPAHCAEQSRTPG